MDSQQSTDKTGVKPEYETRGCKFVIIIIIRITTNKNVV